MHSFILKLYFELSSGLGMFVVDVFLMLYQSVFLLTHPNTTFQLVLHSQLKSIIIKTEV